MFRYHLWPIPAFVDRASITAFARSIVMVLLTSVMANFAWAQDRAKIPSPEQQKKKLELLEKTRNFKGLSTQAKQSLAKDLLQTCKEPELPDDERYVILLTVISLAKEIHHPQFWLEAVNSLLEKYEIDVDTEKLRLIEEFLEAAKDWTQAKLVMDETLVTASTALREHQYDLARQLAAIADKTARRLKNKESIANLESFARSVQDREEHYRSKQKAEAVLVGDPDNREHNLGLGTWLAFYEEDWDAALPHLAKGSDVKLTAAASLEIQMPAEADDQLSLADQWSELAEERQGETNQAIQRHALSWYSRVAKSAKSPLVKSRAAMRSKEIETSLKRTDIKPAVAVVPRVHDDAHLPVNQWIDLMAMIKLPDHALVGVWNRENDTLKCQPSQNARVMAPVAIQGNYEVECEFTWLKNEDSLQLTLPIGETNCHVYLSAGRVLSGLNAIDGRAGKDIPQPNTVVADLGKFSSGHQYRLRAKVFHQGDDVSVNAALGGKTFIDWKGHAHRLSCPPDQSIPVISAIAVTAPNTTVVIHKLQLRLNRGKACRLGDDWQNAISPVLPAPPKEIAAVCRTWGGRKHYVSLHPVDFQEAQRLAARYKGRLLTISSPEEENAIQSNGQGKVFWLSGWRREANWEWSDERNRRLTFFGTWSSVHASLPGEFNLFYTTDPQLPRGVHDVSAGFKAHACIEWGEEFPAGK